MHLLIFFGGGHFTLNAWYVFFKIFPYAQGMQAFAKKIAY